MSEMRTEQTFTAQEVQAALTAVILYERDQAERRLRVVISTVEATIRANRLDA